MSVFAKHHTATSDGAWDGPANEKQVKSGEKREYYGRIYAQYDPAGNEGAKETYDFIHHEVAADGTPGPANMTACSSGIGILNGARGGSKIPGADREGVHAHLAAHLKDGKKEAPPLKSQGEIDYPLVFDSLQGKPWAIEQGKLDEIVALVEAKLEGKQIEWPQAAANKTGKETQEPSYQIQDGVAVISVFGTLDKRMNMFMRFSGGTSYQSLAQQFQQALEDPKVNAILFDIDSPGGAVDGIKTLTDQIFAARGRKPVVAFGSGMMASGAYWIGSAADKVLADDTAHVGSIGVFMTHFDRSGQDAARGIKRTHIFAGKYKTAGSDAEPLSPDTQAYLQGMVDHLYQLFLAGVGQNRGLDSQAVHEQMGDGRIFIGQQAQDAGLVDRIGTFSNALALAQQMASKPGQGRKNMDRATLESQHPELFAEVKGLGAAEAKEAAAAEADKHRAEGQEGERERVVKIFKAVGGQGLLLQVLENGTSHVEALELFLASHEQVKAEGLKAMLGAAPPALGTEPLQLEGHVQDSPGDSVETRAKAEWDKDPSLKETFGTFERYLVVKKNEGNIKSK